MATLIKNDVRYFVRDADCFGRSCLDLGGEIKPTFDDKGLDIRCRMHSVCRRMSKPGCPRELPDYDRWIADKRRNEGLTIGSR
jgi:hypothetical protein